MNATAPALLKSWLPSAAARERLLSHRWEPLFYADWSEVVFLHYEADPRLLQKVVPFPLDLRDGHAYVSLVAFTMRGMHPRVGGGLGAWLCKPVATHEFLNVRTYVRVNDEPGIYFLAEWMPNLLASMLGPAVFGLPYRLGRLEYANDATRQSLHGVVVDAATGGSLEYRARDLASCQGTSADAGSLMEFVIERYTAFTLRRGRPALFRIWHPPWSLAQIDTDVRDTGLLQLTGEWARGARFLGAAWSPGFPSVWMGRPHSLSSSTINPIPIHENIHRHLLCQ